MISTIFNDTLGKGKLDGFRCLGWDGITNVVIDETYYLLYIHTFYWHLLGWLFSLLFIR